MSSRLAIRRAVAISVLGGALLALALPASAHAELVSSDPAEGATVTSLTSVRFEFSEDLLDIGNSITVTDGAGASQDLVVTHPEPTVLAAPVGELAPGDITIAWRNASVDGHTEAGEVHVTLSPPPSPSPSVAPTVQPGSEVTLTAVATTPTAVAPSAIAAVESGSGANPWLWALLGLVVIGGTATAIVAATRRPLHEE